MNTLAHKLMASAVRYAIPAVLVLASLILLTTSVPVLALLPGLGVLALIWFGHRTMLPYLFYGIVLLIPFGAYRGLGGQFSFLRLHWIFAIALAAFVSIQIIFRKRIPAEVRSGKFWVAVLLFYIINIFATLGSKIPENSAQFLLLLAAGFLLVALGMIVVDQKGFAQTLPRVIVGSVFVSSLLTVLGAVFQLKLFLSPLSGQAVGGSPEPNNMSLLIIFSLPLVVYFLLTARRAWVRLALLLVIAINVAAVIATFSRGGALILGISTLLILWEFRRLIAPRNFGLLLGLGGLTLAILLILTPEAYVERVRSLRDFDDFSLRRRTSYLVATRELVADRPLLGNGPDTFASLYAKTEIGQSFWRQHKSRGAARDAHNAYIEVLVGSGVVGLACFLFILAYAAHSFTRARKQFLIAGKPRLALLSVAYRTSFLTLLIYLFIYSGVLHKYLLVALAASQIALRLAHRSPKQELDDACG